MAKPRVYISFDYDHDSDLKILLDGQGALKDSPFEIADWSIKEPIASDWKKKARERIRAVDVVAVVCGEATASAAGVAAEVTIAQEEKIPYFLLKGRSDKTCQRPTTARVTDKIYDWTWDNLKKLIGGMR
jgi:hypothetical protein